MRIRRFYKDHFLKTDGKQPYCIGDSGREDESGLKTESGPRNAAIKVE